MMLEESRSSSLILAATSHPEILDTALYRRFDDVLTYEMPDEQHIVAILKDRLSGLRTTDLILLLLPQVQQG